MPICVRVVNGPMRQALRLEKLSINRDGGGALFLFHRWHRKIFAHLIFTPINRD